MDYYTARQMYLIVWQYSFCKTESSNSRGINIIQFTNSNYQLTKNIKVKEEICLTKKLKTKKKKKSDLQTYK